MTARFRQPRGHLPSGVRAELVASLFATRLPTTIMAVLFAIVGWTALRRTGDDAIAVLLVAGIIANVLRLAFLFRFTAIVRRAGPLADPTDVERRFAIGYMTFAAVLGLFCARGFWLPDPKLHMMLAVLMIGYASGVAAVASLRPVISVGSLLLAVIPATLVALATADMVYRVSAICLLGFLAGGLRSIAKRYRSEVDNIGHRRAFSRLARRDHLTGLPNRLALAEYLRELSATPDGSATVAIHCLDLDDFKPVNDRLGHPAGDALLQAVARRLEDSLRGDDFAARLGGDEFLVVQTGIRAEREAEAMAMRLARSIEEPYSIGTEQISVGVSIGHAITTIASLSPELVTQHADDALRMNKGRRKEASASRVISIAKARGTTIS